MHADTGADSVLPPVPEESRTVVQNAGVFRATLQVLRGITGDATLTLAVLAVSMTFASTYLGTYGQRSDYLLKYYGPAVMIARGKGFVSPDYSKAPALREFLANKRVTLAPEDIPADIETLPPSQFELLHRYAMGLLGWWWGFFGIDWRATTGLLTLFFGITCTCAYGVLRLGMGRILAVLLSLAFMMSPAMLYVLPQFRDFSKAPFILGALFLIGLPVRHGLAWPLLLLIATAAGLTLGVGMGFRHDLLAVAPVACIVVIFFWAGHWKRTLLPRLASAFLLAAAFYLSSAPIIRAAQDGANSAHNIVLGFSAPYVTSMGFTAPYEIGHLYRDAHGHTCVSAHNLYHSSYDHEARYWSGEYEAAAAHYIEALAAVFPADIARRAVRSLEILLRDAPFVIDEFPLPTYRDNEWLKERRAARLEQWGWLSACAMPLAFLTFLLVAAARVRWALAGAFVMAALAASASLQFHVRHFFPYAIFLLFVLGVLAQTCLTALTTVWRGDLRRAVFGQEPAWRFWRWPAARRTGLAVLLAAGPFALAYAGVLVWQQDAVKDLYAAYAGAPRQRLETTPVMSEGGPMLTAPDFLRPEHASAREKAFRVQPGVLALPVQTGTKPFTLEFVYQSDSKLNDFTQVVQVPGTAAPEDWWVYVPVFQTTDNYFNGGQRRFKGILARGAPENAVRGLYAIENPGILPLFVTLVIPEQYEQAPRMMRAVPAKS